MPYISDSHNKKEKEISLIYIRSIGEKEEVEIRKNI